MKPKQSPLIPTMAMEEIGGAYAKFGKPLGESQVEVGFPQEENYSRGIGDAWHPSKTKVGSCYNHKTSQKKTKKLTNNIKNQWQPNIFLFPLIPTKATTTKLVQTLENHPKPIKTIFNQGVAERVFV